MNALYAGQMKLGKYFSEATQKISTSASAFVNTENQHPHNRSFKWWNSAFSSRFHLKPQKYACIKQNIEERKQSKGLQREEINSSELVRIDKEEIEANEVLCHR